MDSSDLRSRTEELLSAGDSRETVDALIHLCELRWFGGNEADALFAIAEPALAMARRLGYDQGEASAQFFLGVAHWLVTRLDESLTLLLEADATFRDLDDIDSQARVRFMLGAVYRSLGDYDQSFLEGLEPVSYFRSTGDAIWEARACMNLAMTCHELGDYEQAKKHNERVLELRENAGEQWIVGRALIGIGAACAAMGQHHEALRYQLRALKTCEAVGSKMGAGRALHELGHCYRRRGDRERAAEHYEKSLALREEIDQREAQCSTLIALGNLYKDSDGEKALGYVKRALEVAERVDAAPRVYQANLALSEVYEVLGDSSKALEHYKEFHRLRFDVAKYASNVHVKNLRTIFDAEKKAKEQEIARLKESVEEGRSLGSYRLIERLGAGGMGEVWVAEHRLLARPAAIKLIRPRASHGNREQMIERFRREAEVTSGLRSPHTVQLFDFGDDASGNFHYVMELLDGMDVAQLVDQFGPVPAPRLIYLMRQVCRSLAEAHEQGLVHRDIKPANLFVCVMGGEYDFLKVLDFGVVKTSPDAGGPELTTDGLMVGTPAYAAPELIVSNAPTDGRSDLYSLGCVAFWMLTGIPVFQADTPAAMMIEHVKTDAPRVSELTEHQIPEKLESLIGQCLAKHPSQRPATAMELWERLGEIEAAADWDEARARSWWRRHAPDVVTRSLATPRTHTSPQPRVD